MHERIMFLRTRDDFLYRLDDARFVVGEHDGHYHSVIPANAGIRKSRRRRLGQTPQQARGDKSIECLHIHYTIRRDWNYFGTPDSLYNRRMHESGNHYPRASQSPVIRFRRRAAENDFIRETVDAFGDGLT